MPVLVDDSTWSRAGAVVAEGEAEARAVEMKRK